LRKILSSLELEYIRDRLRNEKKYNEVSEMTKLIKIHVGAQRLARNVV